MNDIAIKLTNIGKKYTVSHQKPSLIGNMLGRTKSEEFWALKNINLAIKKGERVGIIGPNGAGKTTLLQIIAGITQPTTGKLETKGKIVALMDLEAGFHPDLTGEENIFINGMLVGMNREEIKKKYKQIVKFADIGKFIDAPFYTYSSGMKFRLAFAVAVASECDVLILDEMFMAGDINFQRKTIETIKKTKEKNDVVIIICSHEPFYIWELANIFFEVKNKHLFTKTKKDMFNLRVKSGLLWNKTFSRRYGKLTI